MIRQALILSAAMLFAPAWAVIKCTGADGKIAYQEAPCVDTSKSESLDVPPANPSSKESPYAALLQERLRNAQKACDVSDLPVYPQIGWTEEKFLQCTRYGAVIRPSAVNITESVNGISRQYVYRNAGSYIYTVNGIVTAVQTSN